MNEQQVRQIASSVFSQMSGKGQFSGVSKTSNHYHNGVDSPKINQNNVLPGNRINSGKITFAQVTLYTIATNFNPTRVDFYGIAVNNNASSPTIRAQCIGNALLGGSYYLQPSTSTSVTVPNAQQAITQSSSYILVDTTTSTTVCHALAGQTHLVDVQYPVGTSHARMSVTAYGNDSITISVDVLDSGWQIAGNLVIT